MFNDRTCENDANINYSCSAVYNKTINNLFISIVDKIF